MSAGRAAGFARTGLDESASGVVNDVIFCTEGIQATCRHTSIPAKFSLALRHLPGCIVHDDGLADIPGPGTDVKFARGLCFAIRRELGEQVSH